MFQGAASNDEDACSQEADNDDKNEKATIDVDDNKTVKRRRGRPRKIIEDLEEEDEEITSYSKFNKHEQVEKHLSAIEKILRVINLTQFFSNYS